MNKTLYRIAAVLALIIGAMAVFAGGQVLLGKIPDYYVIGWLPVYNFSMGVLSIFVTAILIWKLSPYALTAAIATFSAHALVMLILQIAYSGVVAIDSVVAMTIRLIVWLIILGLLFFGKGKRKVVAG